MISYIFKSKVKNILVAIISAILVLSSIRRICLYATVNMWVDAAREIVVMLPYLIIFAYMVTLKTEYKIKNWLFPAAFVLLALPNIYLIAEDLLYPDFADIGQKLVFWILLLPPVIEIVLYALCFVGTLSNFKRINFLRVGLIFWILIGLHEQIMTYIYFTKLSENQFFGYMSLLERNNESTVWLLYISIFILTLTKKGENIDITPFIEARKKKIAEKKARKQEDEKEENPVSVVEDGFWRCMGCGEILPNEKDECECGYKRI